MVEPVVSSSLVPGAQSPGLDSSHASRLFSGARGLTLFASLLVHGAVGLVAAHHARSVHEFSAEAPVVAAIDVVDTQLLADGVNEPPIALAVSPPAVRTPAPPQAAPHAAPAVAARAETETAAAAPGALAVVGAAVPESAPRFAITVAAVSNAAVVTASAPSGGTASPGAAGSSAPVAESAVETPARLLVGASPSYTAAAQAAGVEADVPLEIVIDRAGAVQSARGLAHVGYGLDEAALAAVRGFRFSAARSAGAAVAVRMRWLMRFQLR